MEKAKKEAEIYHKQELLEDNLKTALEETRQEPGLSLLDISNIVKKVFDKAKAEVEALIKELKK